jgi:hypothetical protein
MIAMRADLMVFLKLAVENHFVAAWAFGPEIFWHHPLLHQRLYFWEDRVGDPVHRLDPYAVKLCSRLISCATNASRKITNQIDDIAYRVGLRITIHVKFARDNVNHGRSDDGSVGHLAYHRRLFTGLDAKANRDWKHGMFFQSRD